MALKPVTCSGDAIPLDQRILKLAKRLKPGQCYVATDMAREFGVTQTSVLGAAKRVGAYALRAGVRGIRVRGVIVNPAHVEVQK